MSQLPQIGSVWEHTNGNQYRVLHIANEFSQNTEKYPVTVVYQGLTNNLVWSRSADDWHRSMTKLSDAMSAQPVTSGQANVFDLICNAIDKADTLTMEGNYMLDSDDCIAVVRVMQALIETLGSKPAPSGEPDDVRKAAKKARKSKKETP